MTVFTLQAQDGEARAGHVKTAHGEFATPAFMPVGTHASVKACHPQEIKDCGVQILLGNAYHLALRPGVELVERAGGLHGFMGWDGPILTDSGGFQLVSLGKVAAISQEQVTFVSPYDGSRLSFSPPEVVQLQARLGADIIMVLDYPVSHGADQKLTAKATDYTHRWAEQCRKAHPGRDRHLLFGIVQGGFDAQLRRDSAKIIAGLEFDGIAIGGLSLGEAGPLMEQLVEVVVGELPRNVPRYFMGLGSENELLSMVERGIDMFDCVLPTRLARNGTAMTPEGRLPLRRSIFKEDLRPLQEDCTCPACATFSRAYLRHLFMAGEMLAHRLVSLHNITHLCNLMTQAREAIMEGRYEAFRKMHKFRIFPGATKF